jgi:hypothetical protein
MKLGLQQDRGHRHSAINKEDMMKRTIALPATALAVLSLAACEDATGPDNDEFHFNPRVIEGEWRGQALPGDLLEIKGISGDIQASASLDQEIVVKWTKRGQQDDPASVSVQVVQHANGITICAVYPDVPGQPDNECLPGDFGHMATQDIDVDVDFTVTVPAGVDFRGRTISGDINADHLRGDVEGATVSGDVSITTSELAEASTISGSIEASIGRSDWDRDLAFTTVSGSLSVSIPANTNAEVPVLHDGSIRGTLGSGGALLRLSTVAGSVRLRRGS